MLELWVNEYKGESNLSVSENERYGGSGKVIL